MNDNYVDAEALWDKHCFSLDDRSSEVASVKELLNGFDDDCEDLIISRESYDNMLEGLDTNSKGEVYADDIFEYLSFMLEHAPEEVR